MAPAVPAIGADHARLVVDSPFGPMLLVGNREAVTRVHCPGAPAVDVGATLRRLPRVLVDAALQLEEYFSGRRQSFDVPLRPTGDEQQLAVWNAVAKIGFGSTVTYGTLAAQVDRAGTQRQVARMVCQNPLPILIPCHRVVGANWVGGYTGGVRMKVGLLALEGSMARRTPPGVY